MITWGETLPEFVSGLTKINRYKRFPFSLVGVDFSRVGEYYTALIVLGRRLKSARVRGLDIGTYLSPFPAWLATKGVEVVALDVDPRLIVQRDIQRCTEVRFELIFADALYLPFAPETFDFITLISTIEHMPGDDDIVLSQRLGNHLKPGGLVFLTVPFGRQYSEGRWGKWFQRTYTLEALRIRIVKPSGLELAECGFLFGGTLGIIYDVWYRIPALLRHSLGWLQWWRVLNPAMPAEEGDGRVCWMLLSRPGFPSAG